MTGNRDDSFFSMFALVLLSHANYIPITPSCSVNNEMSIKVKTSLSRRFFIEWTTHVIIDPERF